MNPARLDYTRMNPGPYDQRYSDQGVQLYGQNPYGLDIKNYGTEENPYYSLRISKSSSIAMYKYTTPKFADAILYFLEYYTVFKWDFTQLRIDVPSYWTIKLSYLNIFNVITTKYPIRIFIDKDKLTKQGFQPKFNFTRTPQDQQKKEYILNLIANAYGEAATNEKIMNKIKRQMYLHIRYQMSQQNSSLLLQYQHKSEIWKDYENYDNFMEDITQNIVLSNQTDEEKCYITFFPIKNKN